MLVLGYATFLNLGTYAITVYNSGDIYYKKEDECINGLKELYTIGVSGCLDTVTDLVVPGSKVVRGIDPYHALEWYSPRVRAISEGALQGRTNLVSVTLPQTIVYIRDHAFKDCVGLTSIDIATNIAYIASSAFAGCKKLSKFNVAPDSEYYSSVNNLLCDKSAQKIVACPCALVNVRIPDGIKEILYESFYGSEIVQLTIPSSVEAIGAYAFSHCTNLCQIVFEGLPPRITGFAGYKQPNDSTGYSFGRSWKGEIGSSTGVYSALYKSDWKAVIDENGYWHGLKMKMEGAPDSYRVIFDKNGGDSASVESLTRDDGAAIGELPTATREGYDFAGWFTASAGGTKISASTVVTGDVTYYAHWTLRKPETYTIIYHITDGEGSVANQTCEFGEEVYVDDGGTLHWEGHCFAGWALELDGDVAVKPGETVPPPTDGSKIVNLYAKWRPVMLAPLSADWQKGEITLMYGSMEAGMGVSVECRRGDDPSAIWDNIGKEVELSPVVDGHVTITDRNFSSRYDGIPPVEYRVKDTAGGEATCTTRTKYAISVGVGLYERVLSDDGRMIPWVGEEGDREFMADYAELFAKLAKKSGAQEANIHTFTNETANRGNINHAFESVSTTIRSGDICLLYFGTHGGADGTASTLALYGNKEYYTEADLANHIDLFAPDWGVATVCIVHACESGGFANNENDQYCVGGGWCVNEQLISRNAAWITATDKPDVSAYGESFSKFLLGYGWNGGWAGSDGQTLSFGDLADYLGKTYDVLFSGVRVGDNPDVIQTGVTNKTLLSRVVAGICPRHEAKTKPVAFSVTPSTDDPDKVVLKTSRLSADTLQVFSRFVNGGEWSSSSRGISDSGDSIHLLGMDSTVEGEVPGTRHSSVDDKMEFIVKAYNGAGVTAAALVQGWRAATTAQTGDGRTWNYGKVDGGVSIVSAAESSASVAGLKGAVTIPSILEGMPVVSINAYAFEGCEGITSVTIPSSVTSIGPYAFHGCCGLTSVSLPRRFEGNLDAGVFSGCSDDLVISYYDSIYKLVFHRNDASDEKTAAYEFDYGVSTRIPSLAKLGWARRGCDFLGWATSRANADAGKVWKKDWAVVSTAAAGDETRDLYAVWALKEGYYAIEYIRNDGAGTWRTVGFNYGEKTRMPSLANGLGWARRGYDFKGWALTTADAAAGKVWKGDWAYVSKPVKAGQVLTAYAVWALKPGYYQIRFNKNDGTGRWRTLGFEYGVKTRLPTCVNGLGWTREGYEFAGWSLGAVNAAAGGEKWMKWKDDWAYVSTPTTAGRTISIYAIWE